MKKILVASILGVALSVASSYGQGYVVMQNYDLVSVGGVQTPVYAGATFLTLTGPYVGSVSGIQAELFYSLTGAAGSFTLAPGSATSFFRPTPSGVGTFFGPTVAISGYTSGNAFFYVQGIGPNVIQSISQSAIFSMPLQTSTLLAPPDLLNLTGTETTSQGLQPFEVFIMPEPSMFALTCLAGALILFRRRK